MMPTEDMAGGEDGGPFLINELKQGRVCVYSLQSVEEETQEVTFNLESLSYLCLYA